MRKIVLTAVFAASICLLQAQKTNTTIKTSAIKDIDAKYELYKKNALQIWEYAEVGYKEVKSSALHQQTLKDNGFTVQSGVADIPTAFVASYGSGSPVIGILAEFDALPGLSQEATPEKKAAAGRDALTWLWPPFIRYRIGSSRY